MTGVGSGSDLVLFITRYGVHVRACVCRCTSLRHELDASDHLTSTSAWFPTAERRILTAVSTHLVVRAHQPRVRNIECGGICSSRGTISTTLRGTDLLPSWDLRYPGFFIIFISPAIRRVCVPSALVEPWISKTRTSTRNLSTTWSSIRLTDPTQLTSLRHRPIRRLRAFSSWRRPGSCHPSPQAPR